MNRGSASAGQVDRSPGADRRRTRLALWIVIILATLPFLNSLTNEFTFDDRYLIVQNPRVKSLTNVPLLFSSGYFSGYYQTAIPGEEAAHKSRGYRPLVTTSYALNYALGGLNPIGYHVVNLVAHAALSGLAYLVGAQVLGTPQGALVAAALFAVHPLHTEAVTWISGRPELFAACFLLLSWHWRLKGRPAYAFASVAAFALALLSKENAVMLPAILILAHIAQARTGMTRGSATPGALQPTLARSIQVYGAYGVVLGAYLIVRILALGHVLGEPAFPTNIALDNPLTLTELGPRLLTALDVAGRYLGLVLWPHALSADYSYNQIPIVFSPWSTGVLRAAVAWGLLIVLAILSYWRGSGRAFLCVGFTLLMFLPTSNVLFPIGTIMGERLFYLPSLGFCWLAGLAWQRAVIPWRQEAARSRAHVWTATGVLAILILALSWRTVMRNRDWQDSLTLFRSAVEVSPNSEKAHRGLAEAYYDRGRPDEAIEHYRRSLAILPNAESQRKLATLYFQQGHRANAIASYREAVRLDPVDAEARTDLAFVLLKDGRCDLAVVELQNALVLNPALARAHHMVGLCHAMLGDWPKAVAAYERALQFQPDFMEASYGLGIALEQAGRYEEAARAYEQALQVRPEFRKGHRRLAELYRTRLGNETRAAWHEQQASP